MWMAVGVLGLLVVGCASTSTWSPGHEIALASAGDPGDEILLAAKTEKPAKGEAAEEAPEGDQTGTDPRGFGNRFMPYYWYGEMKNDLEVQWVSLFGMIAFEPRVAVTYDWPIAKQIDYGDVAGFEKLEGDLPPDLGGSSPQFGGGGLPFDDLDEDGDVVGMGDLGVRLFWMPEFMDMTIDNFFGFGPKDELNIGWILGAEVIFPTANEDVLGGEALIFSPIVTVVLDTPTMGFLALMNFFDFNTFKDDSRPSTTKWRGRWFLMQPLTKPGPGVLDGVYLMPEFQPIYDFNADEFSLWIGPELGKIVAPGRILYVKPGFGIDPDDAERELTLEVGFRWFF
jgi:hypothetical protein